MTTPPAAPPVVADLPAVPAADELASTLELCEKREAHVTRLVAREVEAARAHAAANNRKAALEAMKRKKLHDKELERLSAQKLSLMQQEQTLHALKFNNVVITTQQNGAAAIEREVKKVKGAEGVDKVLDRLEEALDEAGDVLGASSRVMGEAAGLDDDELLEEVASRRSEDLALTWPYFRPPRSRGRQPWDHRPRWAVQPVAPR